MSADNGLDNATAPGGVPSPCRSLCQLNEDDLCTGCGRSRDDIRRWTTMSDSERLACVQRAAHQRLVWAQDPLPGPGTQRG